MPAFTRTTFGSTEPLVTKDLNQQAARADQTIRVLLQSILSGRASAGSPAAQPYTGFVGQGLAVTPTSSGGLAVQVTPGVGFVYAPGDAPTGLGDPVLSAVDDLADFKPIVLDAPVGFTVPSASGSRIDLVEVRYNRQLTDVLDLVVDPPDCCDEPIQMTIPKTLSWQVDGQSGFVAAPAPSTAAVSYKIGTPGAGAPAVTPGYVALALVNVANGTTAIVERNIQDLRALLAPGGVLPFSASWRLQWNGGAPIVTTHSVQAPPGVQVGLRGLNVARGQADLYVVGGAARGGAVTMTASFAAGIVFATQFTLGIQADPVGADGNPLVSSSVTDSANAANAIPPVLFPAGAPVLRGRLVSRLVSLSGINITDTSLEDAVIRATGCLSYT